MVIKFPESQTSILGVALAAIAANVAAGAVAPITAFPYDDLFLMDGVWRVVQGQHAGADYSNPIGFALFHLAALLWRLFGPHRWILGVTGGLFSAVITICAVYVGASRLHRRPGTRFLFCLLAAYEASAPSVHGWGIFVIGMGGFYDRLSATALAVLFVQCFTASMNPKSQDSVVEAGVLGVLLTILMLTKISAFGLGIVIAASSVLLWPGRLSSALRRWRQTLLMTVFMFAAVAAICGIKPGYLLHEYVIAAKTRALLARGDGMAAFGGSWSLILPIALLVSFGVRLAPDRRWIVRLSIMILTCAVCQLALNLTNRQPSDFILIPVCALVILVWHDRGHCEQIGGATEHKGLWLPAMFCGFLTLPLMLSMVAAALLSGLCAWGIEKPVVISAGGSLQFPVLRVLSRNPLEDYARTINDGILLLRAHGLTSERIATLDYANPFPMMFGAPSPRGVPLVWNIGDMEPAILPIPAAQLFGDACIVMEPLRPAKVTQGNAEALETSAASLLATAFSLVDADSDWKIFRRRGACVTSFAATPRDFADYQRR